MTQLYTVYEGCASSKSRERRILSIEGSSRVTARSLRCADAIRESHRDEFQHISLLGMNKEHRQERKARLALVLAQGRSVAAWAHENHVPRSTAYRWAGQPEVRAAAESSRRRACNRVLGRLARRAYFESYQVVKLAESAESEPVRLRALRSIYWSLVIGHWSLVSWSFERPRPLARLHCFPKATETQALRLTPEPAMSRRLHRRLNALRRAQCQPNALRCARAGHAPFDCAQGPATPQTGHVHQWTYAGKLQKRRQFVSFSLERKTRFRVVSDPRIPFRHSRIQCDRPVFWRFPRLMAPRVPSAPDPFGRCSLRPEGKMALQAPIGGPMSARGNGVPMGARNG